MNRASTFSLEHVPDHPVPAERRPRGFAAIAPERQREIAQLGGRASQSSGNAHRLSGEAARSAGQLGGCRDAARMRELGRKGGKQRAAHYAESFETVIHFEDHGQDFLTWTVRRGEVVSSSPFQSWLWVGLRLVSRPQVGRCLKAEGKHGPLCIRYPVTKIERRRIEQVQS